MWKTQQYKGMREGMQKHWKCKIITKQSKFLQSISIKLLKSNNHSKKEQQGSDTRTSRQRIHYYS